MKIHTLLLAAVLASGGIAFAQTPAATPAVTPAPAPAAKTAAEHMAPIHKMSMHKKATHMHARRMAAAAPVEATTREERMSAAEADYKASMESKSDRPATSHWMHHQHASHHMHMHHRAKAAPAS